MKNSFLVQMFSYTVKRDLKFKLFKILRKSLSEVQRWGSLQIGWLSSSGLSNSSLLWGVAINQRLVARWWLEFQASHSDQTMSRRVGKLCLSVGLPGKEEPLTPPLQTCTHFFLAWIGSWAHFWTSHWQKKWDCSHTHQVFLSLSYCHHFLRPMASADRWRSKPNLLIYRKEEIGACTHQIMSFRPSEFMSELRIHRKMNQWGDT